MFFTKISVLDNTDLVQSLARAFKFSVWKENSIVYFIFH